MYGYLFIEVYFIYL